jgi:quinol-cytochrome oxidoreductase complex cytochrome b subunit
LRSIPDKLMGVIALLSSIVVPLLLPLYLKVAIRSLLFRTFSKILFWVFVVDCLVLGWIGGKPIESPYYEIGQFATVFYFAYFLVILPLLNSFERFLMQYWYSYYYVK